MRRSSRACGGTSTRTSRCWSRARSRTRTMRSGTTQWRACPRSPRRPRSASARSGRSSRRGAQDGTLRPEPGEVGRWRGARRAVLDQELEAAQALRHRAKAFRGAQSADQLAELVRGVRAAARGPAGALERARLAGCPPISDEDWARVRDVAQVLVLAAAELEQVFRERGAVDFPAVSMAALRALGTADAPTDLNLRLDYRLQHILLDEFQDTSSCAARAARAAHRGLAARRRPHHLLRRRSDAVDLWVPPSGGEGVPRAGGGRDRATCDSTCSASAAISARTAPWSIGSTPASPESCRGSTIASAAPSPSGRARAALPAADGFTPEVRVCGFGSREAEALAVAEAVEMRRRQHPEWRIAILVRARTHAREIAHALRTRGIAFRAVDIEPLQDRAGGARHGHAHRGAAAPRRPHGVAGGAARALGRARAQATC